MLMSVALVIVSAAERRETTQLGATQQNNTSQYDTHRAPQIMNSAEWCEEALCSS